CAVSGNCHRQQRIGNVNDLHLSDRRARPTQTTLGIGDGLQSQGTVGKSSCIYAEARTGLWGNIGRVIRHTVSIGNLQDDTVDSAGRVQVGR
ncbi:hypothetical protein OLF92_10915, partial [Streptococcus pneumoniae]|nr:hypothetical protein [Streptococcus pneumoniae]